MDQSQGGGVAGSCPPPQKESRISDSLSRLDDESSNLLEAVKNLLVALEPVMSPQEPEDKAASGSEMQVGSDVVTRIDTVTERLLTIRFRVENGFRRLEI